VQEKQALADAPQRDTAEFATGRVALLDAVSESGPHVVESKVAERRKCYTALVREDRLAGSMLRDMAKIAADIGENLLPTGRRGGRRSRSRSCGEAHEGCKIHNITGII